MACVLLIREEQLGGIGFEPLTFLTGGLSALEKPQQGRHLRYGVVCA